MVLHGRTGQAEPVGRFELEGILGAEGLGVFNILGLVEDDDMPALAGEGAEIPGEQRVGGDDEVGGGDLAEVTRAVLPLQCEHLKMRGEFLRLGRPVRDDRSGCDDE